MTDKTNTPEEILFQVDENDRVVGTVTKAWANSHPEIFHREVRVVLFDKKGRVLIQRRSPYKKVYPGVWAETCQGHVPYGLSYEEAAHKELQEELGFDTTLKLVAKTLIKFPNETHFAAWFVGQYQGEEIKPEPAEVAEYRFVDCQELAQLAGEMIPSSWAKLWELQCSSAASASALVR